MPISFDFSVALPPAIPVVVDDSPAAVAGAASLRDKAFDPLTNDLLITNGDQEYVSGIAAIASDLKSNWLFVKGEYFLDVTKGVDYWGVIFKQGSSIQAQEDEFRREALATEGVAAIALRLTKLVGRMLNVEATVTVDTGLVFNATLAINAGS